MCEDMVPVEVLCIGCEKRLIIEDYTPNVTCGFCVEKLEQKLKEIEELFGDKKRIYKLLDGYPLRCTVEAIQTEIKKILEDK